MGTLLKTDSDQVKVIEALRHKVEEYERWFRSLDNQVRVLERERQKFSAVVNQTDVGFFVVDAALRVVWTNDVFTRRFGAATHLGTLLGTTCSQILGCRKDECALCPAAHAFKTGTVAHHEIRLHLDGQPHQLYATAMPIKSPEGEIDEIIIMLQDITDLEVLRRSQEALKQTLSLLTATLDSTADGILVVDGDGKIVSFNQKFVRMWCLPESVIAARDDNQALAFVLNQLKNPEEFLRKVRELYAQPEGESYDLLEFKDGRIFERYSQPHRIGGKSVGRVWSFRDITELKRQQEELSRTERLRTVGELAASIIHDLKNPMNVILGSAELLNMEGLPAERRGKYCRSIAEQIQRMLILTQDILDFSRGEMRITPAPVNLLELCEEIADANQAVLARLGIRLTYAGRRESGLSPAFSLDREKFWRVMMNLISNARDALSNGGEIRLRCLIAPAEARLEVEDTGQGVPEEIRDRVFEPFVTYGKTRGTGLGLSFAKKIVEAHGGTIAFTTLPGKGSTFSVTLPRQTIPETESPGSGAAPGEESTQKVIQKRVQAILTSPEKR